MQLSLSGRTAVVTGAAHGLGRAIAHAFDDAGANVWIGDVLGDELEQTRALCGRLCRAATLDVTRATSVDSFIENVLAAQGRVDVLVNNAGGVLGQTHRPLEQVDADDWQSIFDVNVTGAFYCSQAVVPAMKQARHGRIINISSGAGLRTSLTGIQAYAAAKAGQIGLTRQLAHELGPWGITVNSVAPGFVLSNPTTKRQWEGYGPAGQERLSESIFLRRLGVPEDIAKAVLFFASDLAGWVTGQILSVDGGHD